MSVTASEIESQPAMWQRAAELLPSVSAKLPAAGERVAVIGCGTSYFIAQAVADAARVSRPRRDATRSWPPRRRPSAALRPGDRDLALRARPPRSCGPSAALPAGTRVAGDLRGRRDARSSQGADRRRPARRSPTRRSIVQTRFATTALALLRAHLGDDLDPRDRRRRRHALARPLPVDPSEFEQFVVPRATAGRSAWPPRRR